MFTIKTFRSNMENPFNSNPRLFEIWEPIHAAIAKEAIDEYRELSIQYPNADQGKILLIFDSNVIIGISGYFPSKEDFSEFTLRWHGLLPEYQKHGLSEVIITYVTESIKTLYPTARTLIEMMPADNQKLHNYFVKLGFKASEQTFELDWSEHTWKNYMLNL